jgi:4'-phosphopantetheinyl transferase
VSGRPDAGWWGGTSGVSTLVHRDAGPPPGADVWYIRLDVDDEVVRLAGALLDGNEQRRAERMRDPVAAQRYVVAHGAIRTVLGGYLGVAGYALHWSTGVNGKPAFDGGWSRWQWSLSRSGGHALLAVCLAAPVGVDLERIRARTPAVALATRYLTVKEAAHVAAADGPRGAPGAYHRFLSRKEACVKASGGRLLDALRLDVLMPGEIRGSGAYAGQRWELQDLPAPPDFVAALATTGTGLDKVRFFEWDCRLPGGPATRRDPALSDESQVLRWNRTL